MADVRYGWKADIPRASLIRMGISDFCAACEWLAGDGLEISEATYSGQSFGSWFINVLHKGGIRRAVWDGRDRWLVIQSKGSNDDWKDEWVSRDTAEHTVENVVSHLRD